MIVVYGGAQVDAPHRSSPRFPERHVEQVGRQLRVLLLNLRPRLVVGSAASGADLLVLEIARAEEIASHIVLPFSTPKFIETSVASRGEAWVTRYEELVDPADVEILHEIEDDEVYHRTNATVLERAAALAHDGEEIVLVVVRPPKGDQPSVSDDLAERGAALGYRVIDIDPSQPEVDGFEM